MSIQNLNTFGEWRNAFHRIQSSSSPPRSPLRLLFSFFLCLPRRRPSPVARHQPSRTRAIKQYRRFQREGIVKKAPLVLIKMATALLARAALLASSCATHISDMPRNLLSLPPFACSQTPLQMQSRVQTMTSRTALFI